MEGLKTPSPLIRKSSLSIPLHPDKARLMNDAEKASRRNSIAQTFRRLSFAPNAAAAETMNWSRSRLEWILLFCQEIISRILRGEKVDANERTNAANAVQDLASESLAPIFIDLFENELISTSTSQLRTEVFEVSGNIRSIRLAEIWQTLYYKTIPDLTAVLYPLEAINQKFSVRLSCLVSFRDVVFLAWARESEAAVAGELSEDLRQILLLLELLTRDDSENYRKLQSLLVTAMPETKLMVDKAATRNHNNMSLELRTAATVNDKMSSPAASRPENNKTIRRFWDKSVDHPIRRHSAMPSFFKDAS